MRSGNLGRGEVDVLPFRAFRPRNLMKVVSVTALLSARGPFFRLWLFYENKQRLYNTLGLFNEYRLVRAVS